MEFSKLVSHEHLRHSIFYTFKHDQVMLAIYGCHLIVKC